jgi:hypothetical protein
MPTHMNIDAILYINLEHRTDRKEHVLREIHKLCKDDSKIHRIDAIKREPGILGCGLSHKKALEYARDHPEWRNVLILEDDFTFKDVDVVASVDMLQHHAPQMDVGLLSFNPDKLRYADTSHPNVKKVYYSQTASSYLIRKEYIPVLLKNVTEGVEDMETYGKAHRNCIDIHWTLLQPCANWYAIYPAIGHQYDNYSDIEKRVMSYGC